MGALYVERGYSAVKTWINPLVDPEYNPTSPSSGSFGGSMANPPPPASPPPPLPGNTTGVFLASFNQMAAQRGVKIEWTASQSGPGHALTWRVECIGKQSLLFGDRAGSKLLFGSWWNTEGNGGWKKQATGERGGCAAGTRGVGLGLWSVGSIPLCVFSPFWAESGRC